MSRHTATATRRTMLLGGSAMPFVGRTCKQNGTAGTADVWARWRG